MKYVLITAARNESAFIERTLQSVVTQTQPPERWVIVDDGSTDESPKIAAKYAKAHPWIELVQRPKRSDRSFAGKAYAVNAGWDRVQDLEFDVVGNLDADVSFGPDYMAFVMERFEADPALGVGGTPFTEEGGYDSTRDSFEGENYVAGPCQLFRHACFQDIGGYVPNKAGGVDWIAVMTARMKGWTVRAFPRSGFTTIARWERPSAAVVVAVLVWREGLLPGRFAALAGVSVRLPHGEAALIVGGLALFAGYCTAALRRMPRAVSPELMRFHRAEQMRKLRACSGRFRGSGRWTTLPSLGNSADASRDSRKCCHRRIRRPSAAALIAFVRWLDGFGETSWDHQSFFAGPWRVGQRSVLPAPAPRHAAVAPMIFFEAFLPAARRLFHRRSGFRSPTPTTRWALPSFTKRPGHRASRRGHAFPRGTEKSGAGGSGNTAGAIRSTG